MPVGAVHEQPPVPDGAGLNISCPLTGGRSLHSRLLTQGGAHCARPVLEDVAASQLAIVATYSAGSLAAQRGFRELNALGVMLLHRQKFATRAIAVGKGSRCSAAGTPFDPWRSRGLVHCIEGPNVGAREAHTIWAFCYDFYRHLPRVVLFVQDDPSFHTIRRDLVDRTGWAEALEQSYAKREAAGRRSPLTAPYSFMPWVPSACACSTVRETFNAREYGGYRPLHWWLRSFLAPFANASAPLPERLMWPAMAQFMLPRAAIRRRSRDFLAFNMRVTEVPAPLKQRLPRATGSSDKDHARTVKWANFGAHHARATLRSWRGSAAPPL